MAADPVERKLAAILSADVVGYSRLMAEDEQATIRTLTDYREEIAMLVRQHRGRVVDSPGDNVLAEFPTALDAVHCATEIQRSLYVRNIDLPAERRMEFRVGVHLGDVAVEGDRLYGDGVNIAARLEGLAEASGICISATVHEQVESKLPLAYTDIGEQQVKNIPKPVRAYRVRVEPAVAAPKAESRARSRALLLGGILVLLGVAGVLFWRFSATPPSTIAADERFTVPGFGGRPAIAVLPFDNLSGDPEQEYFADGLTEDLITRLSTGGTFPVIARNSSFTYKGKAVDVKQVSRELGVRYVVEGSVRKADDRIRISAQLIEATTGHHVWAETYDRELRDIFALQDEITGAIGASMGRGLWRAEAERGARQGTQDLGSYDYIMRGWWHFQRRTKEDNAQARVLFQRAAELDPRAAEAFSGLAWTHWFDILLQWTDSPSASPSMIASIATVLWALHTWSEGRRTNRSPRCRLRFSSIRAMRGCIRISA
jgi:adenylate cyclase